MNAPVHATREKGGDLHILQIVPEVLPTFRADVAVLFGDYLPRHGIRCALVGKPSELAVSAASAQFERVDVSAQGGGRLRREFSFLATCAAALLRSSRRDCAVIQVRDMVSIGLLGLIVARCKGLPFAYWMSFLMCEGRIAGARALVATHGGLRSRLVLFKGLLEERILYRFILPYAQHVFVQSEAMLEMMASKGVPRERLSAVPMGVNTEVLAAGAVCGEQLANWTEGPLLAYLGTLDPSRQIVRMIDALAIVRATVPDARLLLIGGAARQQDVAELQAHAELLGLGEAVRITGWLPSERAWKLLMSADAAISYIPRSLIYDVSSPTKLLEYLALGMPVVANDSPDQVRVLEGSDAGWLVESSTEAMADG
ncbi:MAG: glycosyltransferase, partial [Janthinobacterium lividum]|nr:glycosyltransferase [Janthinobacterium lividum]